MGNQLTVVVLEVSQHVHGGVVDRIVRAFADIRELHFLDCRKFFLHESLLHPHQLLEHMHYLGLYDPNVGICVGGCSVRDDDQTWVSRVDEGSG